jgi:hypothetical protein
VSYDENLLSGIDAEGGKKARASAFANRLMTGLAAERYFETNQPTLDEFRNYSVENTTRIGCGYDFRLRVDGRKDFLAVEVKGMKGRTGGLSLTPKEYQVATELSDRFILFVVKTFRESPFHESCRNPLAGALQFDRRETVVVNISWLTTV